MKYSPTILLPISFLMMSCGQIQDIFPIPSIPILGAQSAGLDKEEKNDAPIQEAPKAPARETSKRVPQPESRNREKPEFLEQAGKLGIGTSERILFRVMGPPHASVDMGTKKIHMYHGVMLTVEEGKISSMPENLQKELSRGIENELLAEASRGQRSQSPIKKQENQTPDEPSDLKGTPNPSSITARRNMVQDVMNMAKSE
ncbi:MAG: hypothetical protein JJU29_23210 [Verrucomicrobia bacterium]|nr:hypothetical protein [Verrucomicrobiota bacterium]MCH8510629.1 hypothetical protein [Kiritimatiellia bacterium]